MKKISEKIILLPAVFFMLSAFSCKSQEDDIILKKPNISVSDDHINVSIAANTDAEYINILRKVIDSSDILNIGEIIPTEYDTSDSYIFEDYEILYDTKYTYQLRYKIKSGYSYSDWSDWPNISGTEVPAPSDLGMATSNDELCLSISTDAATGEAKTYFYYDSEMKCLKVKGDPISTMPRFDGFYPCLVVSYGEKIRPFKIKDGVNTADSTTLFDTDEKIDLRSILTLDFFDRDISIDGIIFEYNDCGYTSDGKNVTYDKLIWSQVKKLQISTTEDSVTETATINVPINTSDDDGHDLFKNQK